MTIEEFIFQKVKINREKLSVCGFRSLPDRSFVCEKDFCGGDFRAVLTVDASGHISGKVIENETGDEYLPLRIQGASGNFVHHVRDAYAALLRDVALDVGTPTLFHSDQANRIAQAVTEQYGDAPDFPWKDNASRPDPDSAVIRHPENNKWYALFLYTAETHLMTDEEKAAAKEAAAADKRRRAEERQRRVEAKKAGKKLPPVRKPAKKTAGTGAIRRLDILNLKIRQEDRERLLQTPGVYPSFHMSQKTWISVRLDDTLPDAEILGLIEQSYRLTAGGATGMRPGGRRVWLVPANPKYYDLISVFSQTDDTTWKQGKGIETGDIIYMYVAVPYSAVLYKCTVTQAYSGTERTEKDGHTGTACISLMKIHIDDRYARDLCPLKKMKEYGVTNVRGPRFMPAELEAFIEREAASARR